MAQVRHRKETLRCKQSNVVRGSDLFMVRALDVFTLSTSVGACKRYQCQATSAGLRKELPGLDLAHSQEQVRLLKGGRGNRAIKHFLYKCNPCYSQTRNFVDTRCY
jgi:hypothetical protein